MKSFRVFGTQKVACTHEFHSRTDCKISLIAGERALATRRHISAAFGVYLDIHHHPMHLALSARATYCAVSRKEEFRLRNSSEAVLCPLPFIESRRISLRFIRNDAVEKYFYCIYLEMNAFFILNKFYYIHVVSFYLIFSRV